MMTEDTRTFIFPQYRMPDFQTEALENAPDATLQPAPSDGVAPENYHATTIYPEYYKIDGRWTLLEQSRMDCAVVIGADGTPDAREFRNIKKGDSVVVGRCDDGSCGIYVHAACFCDTKSAGREFTFRTVRSRETAYTISWPLCCATSGSTGTWSGCWGLPSCSITTPEKRSRS
jgi:hypothetical protein